MKTLPVTTQCLDIVYAGNGYVYAFPDGNQFGEIHGVHVATATEAPSATWSIRAGTLAKLHPGGRYMYGADRGASPSDIEKYDVGGATAAVLYDDGGSYAMCGDLWISEDGERIFTRCGNVFRPSTLRTADMMYVGVLPGLTTTIRHLITEAASGGGFGVAAF